MSISEVSLAQSGQPPVSIRKISFITRLLHWTIATLLIGSFVAAWTFNALEPGPAAALLVEAHRSVGLVLLGLMLARLAWRLSHSLPELPGNVSRWEKLAAFTVQAILYGALLAMPLIGWVGSNAEGDTVQMFGVWVLPDLVDANKRLAENMFSAHSLLGWVVLGLVALHIAGALRHHFIKRDTVLVAMLNGRHS